MILDELRAAVQPLIEDNFDEVYAGFTKSSGTDDLGSFLIHLRERGTLTSEELTIIGEVYPE